MSTIFRQSIVRKILDRSRAEFAHFTRLNTILTHSSKTLTRILRKIFAHPKRRSPPVASAFTLFLLKRVLYSASLHALNRCAAASVRVFLKNRVPTCPLTDMYILEVCIAAPHIPSVYTTHQQKKQRQVRDLSLFPCYDTKHYAIINYNSFALEFFKEGAFGDAQIAGAAEGGEGTVLL